MPFSRNPPIICQQGLKTIDKAAQWRSQTYTLLLICGISPAWRIELVRLRLRDNESVQDAVRRFRKLVEHSGVKKELRKREFYEKPSELNRREKRRAKNRARMNQMMNG